MRQASWMCGAVGRGMLRVIKDMGLKEPYVGRLINRQGNPENLTYYFATQSRALLWDWGF